MKLCTSLVLCCALASQVFSAGVAIFPARGVNADQSYLNAFSALLAMKYAKATNQQVLAPRETEKALALDSNCLSAAQSLGVSEYVLIDAIGLYISKKEQASYDVVGSDKQITVNIKRDDDDDDDEDDEVKLVDNNKTIVTVVRHSAADGSVIYRSEMTLLTYGDIEESTERMSQSLSKSIPVEQTRTSTTITRREGVGNNRLFQEKISGVKMGGLYSVMNGVEKINPIVSIGYNMRMESEEFFAEFGAGALLPSGTLAQSGSQYGGNYIEMGASKYIVNQTFPVYVGATVMPFFNWLNGLELGLMPSVSVGVMSNRAYRTRLYAAFSIAQNVLPVRITKYTPTGETDWMGEPEVSESFKTGHPTVFSFQFGIGW